MSEPYSGSDITVVIPAHNCERYILEALQSVESQTARPWSVIVVENASTDKTRDCIEAYALNSVVPVRLVRTDCPGVSNARNLGFSLTETPLIAMLDADDLYAPQFLEQALEAYNAIENLVLFFGNRKPLQNGEVIDEPFLEKTRLQTVPYEEVMPAIFKVTESLFDHLVYGSFVSCSGAVVRRDAAYAAELFPTFLAASEDRYFFTKLSLQGAAAYTNQLTHFYRAHDSSRTGRSEWLEIARSALLCLQSLRLEAGKLLLDPAKGKSLEHAFRYSKNNFYYTAAENGVGVFLAEKSWAARSGVGGAPGLFYWAKAVKNSLPTRS
ncbi:glycosyltransferase family 2 protein [Marinobacter sp.]|uniref:glycosyltransferase family 2 protein n=1 Tax=Marinobacter sp. TaxID=50741 RepID=UPI00384B66CF